MENERGGRRDRLKELFSRLGKFRYALLVLLAGAVLMLFPSKGTAPGETSAQPAEAAAQTVDVEKQLAALLAKVEGAGRVEVMLSLDYGAESFYQTDERKTGTDTYERETVFAQTGSSARTPVVTRTREPVYKGAIIVCEGADRASVELAVVRAVSRLTGLGSDKISVLKMK